MFEEVIFYEMVPFSTKCLKKSQELVQFLLRDYCKNKSVSITAIPHPL